VPGADKSPASRQHSRVVRQQRDSSAPLLATAASEDAWACRVQKPPWRRNKCCRHAPSCCRRSANHARIGGRTLSERLTVGTALGDSCSDARVCAARASRKGGEVFDQLESGLYTTALQAGEGPGAARASISTHVRSTVPQGTAIGDVTAGEHLSGGASEGRCAADAFEDRLMKQSTS